MDKKMKYFFDEKNFKSKTNKKDEKEMGISKNEDIYPTNSYPADSYDNEKENICNNIYTNDDDIFDTEDFNSFTDYTNDDLKIITSRTYTASGKHGRWSKKENFLFYRALELCGLEFSLVEQIVKTRSRKQIKNKFKKELKGNGDRIKKILSLNNAFNNDEFEKLKNWEE